MLLRLGAKRGSGVGLAVHCGRFSSIHGLYLLEASRTPPSCANKQTCVLCRLHRFMSCLKMLRQKDPALSASFLQVLFSQWVPHLTPGLLWGGRGGLVGCSKGAGWGGHGLSAKVKGRRPRRCSHPPKWSAFHQREDEEHPCLWGTRPRVSPERGDAELRVTGHPPGGRSWRSVSQPCHESQAPPTHPGSRREGLFHSSSETVQCFHLRGWLLRMRVPLESPDCAVHARVPPGSTSRRARRSSKPLCTRQAAVLKAKDTGHERAGCGGPSPPGHACGTLLTFALG